MMPRGVFGPILGIVILAGCAPTFRELVAGLPDEERAVAEAAIAMNQAKTWEEFDSVTTVDAVLVSSYLSWDGTGKATFTNKRAYWEALSAKRKGDLAGRSSERRDLQVKITSDNAEVTWVLDVISRRGGGTRDWKGSVDYLFRLRKESRIWKVYYFQQ